MPKALALGGVDDVGAAAREEREMKADRRGIFHELDGGEVEIELVRAPGGRAGAGKEALVRHRVIAVPGVVTVDDDGVLERRMRRAQPDVGPRNENERADFRRAIERR